MQQTGCHVFLIENKRVTMGAAEQRENFTLTGSK
jgi:hypothetical protein